MQKLALMQMLVNNRGSYSFDSVAPPQKMSSQGKCGLINQIIMMMFLFLVEGEARNDI